MMKMTKMDLPATEIIQDNKKGAARVEYRPLGVVAGITPWNFPVNLVSSSLANLILTKYLHI
jgi:acyl-CoA reductase-like NAD-dependent aldehyde dehydrogenase